jgi:AcrR family transcriptional regulator
MVPPRPAQPDTADRLVDAAARLLAEEGEEAVTARRLGREIGASSMAVYTHFGSMEDVIAATLRHGFQLFGAALDAPSVTNDPVADWMLQGWGYRKFALDNPHLYRVMFGSPLHMRTVSTDDDDSSMQTFRSLLDRLTKCIEAERFAIDDVWLAGEYVWAVSHGICSIELTGYFDATQRPPEVAFNECMLRSAIGFGDDPARADRSARVARRRSRDASRRR